MAPKPTTAPATPGPGVARAAAAFPDGAGPVIVLNTTVVLLPIRPGETVSVAPPVDDGGVKVVVTGSVTVTTLGRPPLPLAVAVVCAVVVGPGPELGTGVGLGGRVLLFVLVDVPVEVPGSPDVESEVVVTVSHISSRIPLAEL